MAKHLLYLTNHFITGYGVDSNRIKSSERFSSVDGNTRDFERYLVRHRRQPVHLLLDLTEEDFRAETIPHLRGSDQQAVLGRRMAQIYRNSPFRHAIIQGREADGRRDDRVLYHGIPNADLIRPWLAVIEKLEVPLEGIYSAPVLSDQLLQPLDVFSPHLLLVSLSSGNGLRQTYFQNRHVKFSRLTHLQGPVDEEFGTQVAEECSRTWQYLDSLRFLSGEDQLEVCIVVPKGRRDQISRAIKDFPLLQFRLLDDADISRALKSRSWQGTEYADELWVTLFSQSRLKNHFAQSDQTRSARLRRAGTGLQLLSGALMAGAAIGTIGMLSKGQQYSAEAARLQNQSQQLTRQYQDLMGQMQGAQVSADTSKDAAAFSAGFLEPATSPTALLLQISQVVGAHPEVRVQAIGWKMSSDESASPPAAAVERSAPLPVRTEAKGRAESGAGRVSVSEVATSVLGALQGASTDVVVPGSDYQIAVIQATLGPFRGDYRELLDKMNRFVADLGRIPGIRASLAGAPLDVRSSGSIKGELSGGTGFATAVPFQVRVVRLQRPVESAHGK